MSVSVQTTFRGVDSSESLKRLIAKEAAKLDEIFARIVHCHVIVEREAQHSRTGAPFRVRIDLTVPGAEIAIDTARHKTDEALALHKDLPLTVRDAFRRARRRLQDWVRQRR